MSDNIVQLSTIEKPVLPVDQDLIETLEMLLERAKSGEMQGIAYVTVASTGAGTYQFSGEGWMGAGVTCNMQVAIGGLTILANRMSETILRSNA